MLTAAGAKTLSLLLLIAVGFLFRKKIGTKEQRDGIRTIILGLALPATIFIALLKIEFVPELILVPCLALAFNLVMYGLVNALPVQSLFGLPSSQHKALLLLIPSLAPGLSAFPFIMEYSGDNTLAVAALADLGNKVFVLVVAYMLAMKWYLSRIGAGKGPGQGKLKGLVLSLVNEPVNLVILAAVGMLSLGLDFAAFPSFVQESIDKLGALMAPLVLLFIGLSVNLRWVQVKAIFSFLFFRSAISFLLSGLLLLLLPLQDIATTLLIIVFPQSACSFWPYAHMAMVGQLETSKGSREREPTFDQEFAMNLLACSLPFSVVVILTVYSTGELIATPPALFASALGFLGIAAVPVLISLRGTRRNSEVRDPGIRSELPSRG